MIGDGGVPLGLWAAENRGEKGRMEGLMVVVHATAAAHKMAFLGRNLSIYRVSVW